MPEESSSHFSDRTQIVSEEMLQQLKAARDESHAFLVVISGEDIGREIRLGSGETPLGRSVDGSGRIRSRSVSRLHAVLSHTVEDGADKYRICDAGSMNGTRVNNDAVQSAEIQNGDKLQLGDVVFKFVVQDDMEAQFHRAVHQLIHFEQLTGLMTMQSFRRTLDDTIRASKNGSIFSLAMTDLDGLKKVNDTHGHLAGRSTVAAMGAMMRATLRQTDYAGLYGGDEAIILFSGSPLAEAVGVAEKLREVIEARDLEHGGNVFHVTISQGLAEWPRHGRTAEELIAAADAALYNAKASGRNCVRTADDAPAEK